MPPRRYELTDFEWAIILPLLPDKPRGVPRADDRKVLNGIYWRLRTGALWALHHLHQPLCALATTRGLGPHLRGGDGGL